VTAASDIAVYQHYDAGPWNVHISRRQPCFVDWESDDRRPADSLGPPLTDVLYLVTYWYFAVTRASARGTEEQALLDLFVTRMPRDAAIEAGRRTIDASLRRLDFARDSVPPLLTALWAERALYTDARHGPTETRSERDDSSSPERVMKVGLSRPESYLRTLASCSDELFATDGYWAFPVGTGMAHDHLSRRSTPIID
jgi:hypothetical protein